MKYEMRPCEQPLSHNFLSLMKPVTHLMCARRCSWLLCICWLMVAEFCLPVLAQRGLYGFLRNEANARAAAMSGTFVSITNDVSALFYNPATISTIDSSEVSATFAKHALDINSGTVAYALPLADLGFRDNGSFGVGVRYMNYGEFQRTDKNGNRTGTTFGGSDIALSFVYSNMLDSTWHYGVAVKYIHNRLDNVGSAALAVDAGMVYRIPKARASIGVSVLHLGTQIHGLGGVREELPMDIRLGVNHALRGLPLLLSVSLNRLADPAPSFFDRFANVSVGGEILLTKFFHVRVGYENQRRRELAPELQPRLSGFSGGAGLILPMLRVDYGVNSYGMVGLLHTISLSVRL